MEVLGNSGSHGAVVDRTSLSQSWTSISIVSESWWRRTAAGRRGAVWRCWYSGRLQVMLSCSGALRIVVIIQCCQMEGNFPFEGKFWPQKGEREEIISQLEKREILGL